MLATGPKLGGTKARAVSCVGGGPPTMVKLKSNTPYVYVYLYLGELILRHTYLKTKDLGILDMNFHCAYPWFRVYRMVDTTSCFAKNGGGTLHHSCRSFHLKVSTSSCVNLFKWILYFIVYIWGLGFRKQHIKRCAHYEEWGGKLCTIVVEFFTWEILQVLASFYKFLYQLIQMDSIFYLWLLTFESLVLLESFFKFLLKLIYSPMAFNTSVVWKSCIYFLSLLLLHESFCKLLCWSSIPKPLFVC
jgi:hypothetical protein